MADEYIPTNLSFLIRMIVFPSSKDLLIVFVQRFLNVTY